MKHFYLLFIAFVLFSCQKEKSKTILPADLQEGDEIVFTAQDKVILDQLFNTNKVQVKNNVLVFDDFKSYDISFEMIYKMKPDEYVKYMNDIGFNSLRMDLLNESVDIKQSDLIDLNENNTMLSKIYDDRLVSSDGLKVIGRSLIFNNDQHVKSCSIVNVDPSVYTLSFLEKNYDVYHRYEENNTFRSSCMKNDWEKSGTWKSSGQNRWFTTKLNTWTSAYPERDLYGGFNGWNIYEGYSFDNIAERSYLFGKRGMRKDLYAKIDTYMSNNPDFQWKWKTCSSCKRLDWSKATANYKANNPPFGRPLFNPLIWYVGMITNSTGDQFKELPWGNGFYNTNPNLECATGYSNNIPRFCWGCDQ